MALCEPSLARSLAMPMGGKQLVEVIEEEKHSLAGGDSKVVRSTSDPDVNGNLQLIRRRIEETKKSKPNVEDTKTTVMLPERERRSGSSGEGARAPRTRRERHG